MSDKIILPFKCCKCKAIDWMVLSIKSWKNYKNKKNILSFNDCTLCGKCSKKYTR